MGQAQSAVQGESFIQPQKQLHVAGALLRVLPVKSLTTNVVANVADFPDLYVNLSFMAIFDHDRCSMVAKIRRNRRLNCPVAVEYNVENVAPRFHHGVRNRLEHEE